MSRGVGARASRIVLLFPLVLGIRAPDAGIRAPARLDVAVDLDDDDEDGVPDHEGARPPPDDLRVLHTELAPGRVTITLEGPIRAFRGDSELARTQAFTVTDRMLDLAVQSTGLGAASVSLAREGEAATRVSVVAHEITFEDARGRLDPTRDALLPAGAVPSERAFAESQMTADAFRVHVSGPDGFARTSLRRVPRGETSRREGGTLPVSLAEGRSAPLRIVASELDAEAPLVQGRLFRAALRDRVDAELTTPSGVIAQSVRVGRPSREDGPRAARRLPVVVHFIDVPRATRDAIETAMARQITLADETFSACALALDIRTRTHESPSQEALITFGEDGIPAGGGTLAFRVDGAQVPLVTRRGDRGDAVAAQFADALRARGFVVSLHALPRLDRGTTHGVDVLVRRPDGTRATLLLEHRGDARLDVALTRVSLADGLAEFDNTTATSGSREERALVLSQSDADPRTVDVFVVPAFSNGSRVGEAFVPRDGGPLAGSVLLELRALALTEVAFTLAHELGHVLLDMPLHTGDLGVTSRTSLMATGSGRGDLRASRRLDAPACARMRTSPLLERGEPR